MSKILFILKRREDYNAILHSAIGLSTGLYNSAKFMNDMMVDMGFNSKLEVATDNNCIDRLVTKHKPTHVIIEALWIVPSKFTVLQRLHPNVKWIIRLHSEMPFMSGEGMAMDWLGDYAKFKNITIACNAPRMLREIENFLGKDKVIYLPNFYPQEYRKKRFDRKKDIINVSCFGAIRPLKNHLIQAFAAIDFANKIGKKLHFHINAGRIEMKGDSVKNNLKGLFQHIYGSGHELINHQWTPREEFLKICSEMDIGLQCNFSETFNIVSADIISQGVPIVGCYEIPWSTSLFNARPAESKEICDKLLLTYGFPQVNVLINQRKLTSYTNKTKKIWYKYFTN
jgi:hypothetical protein